MEKREGSVNGRFEVVMRFESRTKLPRASSVAYPQGVLLRPNTAPATLSGWPRDAPLNAGGTSRGILVCLPKRTTIRIDTALTPGLPPLRCTPLF